MFVYLIVEIVRQHKTSIYAQKYLCLKNLEVGNYALDMTFYTNK